MTGFFHELRRRRVFRTAALYIVGAWLVLQAADVFFPGWGLPESALNILLIAAILGFPLALVFGWFFDVTTHGVVRTPSASEETGEAPLSLQRSDYAVLGVLVLFAGGILYDAVTDILRAPVDDETFEVREKLDHSIAVLPFANVSNDPDNEYFCDGISEEILNRLSAHPELHVIARTSSRAFKGSDYGVERIANLLGVRHLVQGSVRKAGDRLRISAQLVDDQGVQVWSETFDRDLADVFAIQDEIADVVASTILPQITPSPETAYTSSTAAYDHYLRGREWVYMRHPELARPELRTATELDPEFAEAWAEYAIALMLHTENVTEAAIEARHAVDRALELHPGLPRALAAEGLLLQEIEPPDNPGAIRALRAALDGDPNMVDAMNWLGNPLRVEGDEEEATVWLKRAYELDPMHPIIGMNVASQFAEEGDTLAQERVLRSLADLPNPSDWAYAALRDMFRANGQLVRMNELGKERALRKPFFVHYDLALNYALLGKHDTSDYWLERSMKDHPNWPYVPYYPSLSDGWRGRYVEAVAVYEQILDERGVAISDMPNIFRHWLGQFQGLTGDCTGTGQTLSGTLDDLGDASRFANDTDAAQALFWACRDAPEGEAVRAKLLTLEESFGQFVEQGRSPGSDQLYRLARNAALLDRPELALERLEAAIDAGWRDYYREDKDPRWDSLRDDPRFQAMMEEVRADVDRQRVEVEELDAAQDFPALLDRVQATAESES